MVGVLLKAGASLFGTPRFTPGFLCMIHVAHHFSFPRCVSVFFDVVWCLAYLMLAVSLDYPFMMPLFGFI